MAESAKKAEPGLDPEVEEPKAEVEEPKAEVEEPKAEAAAATVAIHLSPSYSGPTPVHVSVSDSVTGAEHRIEDLSEKPVEVPQDYAEDFLTLPFVEAVE